MNVLNILLFSFALLTDVHVSNTNPQPLEDLQRSVADINAMPDVDFVIVSGDLTESGDRRALETVKGELDKLRVPYYATSGNHETTWSESGVMDFSRVFGSNRFAFTYDNTYFIGFNSGPVIRMADGHVAPQDIAWLQSKLDSVANQGDSKIIVVTHYPLQNGDVDNWFDVTDVLRRYNVQCIIGGHYHRNLLFDCDGIPDVINRSNLRGNDSINGYSWITVTDSIRVSEKRIGQAPVQWLSLPFGQKHYGAPDPALRPDYSVNEQYRQVREVWSCQLTGGIYSTPVSDGHTLYIGDDIGTMYALDARTGKTEWTFATGMRIVGSPAEEDGVVVFGSTNDTIYGLRATDGKPLWRVPTGQAVMGAVAIHKGVAYIGGGDGYMRAIDIHSGEVKWAFGGLGNYVLTRPLVYRDKLYFGCWDTYFYALNLNDGSLVWRWTNGKSNEKLSPASVWPVASDGKIFITAPDRFWTCLDAETGAQIWRTNQYKVRETVGLSENGKTVYSKCMWDDIVALDAMAREPQEKWVVNAGFGYEHDPCMPLEKGGTLWVGTKNGLLIGMDAKTGRVMWRHKIGNSILNTVLPLSGKECIVTSSEGTITRIKF
mgnify:FL=1